jgi:hypothetical protein
MRITMLTVAILAVVFTSPARCQLKSPVTGEEKSKVVANSTFRPKLSLQEALQKAEKFIATEKIDTSQFWLYRALYILMGESSKPDREKVPGWHFWWVSDSGGLGNYVEIFVSMDGDCVRMPSM